MAFKRNQVVYFLEPGLETLKIGVMQIDNVETDAQQHCVYTGFTLNLYQTYLRKCEEVLFSSKAELLDSLQCQINRLMSK